MGPRPVKSQVSIMAPGGEKRTQMNPFSQVSSTVLWILLATLATICLVVLMTVSYLYAALVNKPPHPLEESMKKLGVTIAVGLRSPTIKHEDALKVAEEAVRLPDHIKDSGKTFNDQKKKYNSLFRKSQKSGTEWQPFGNGLYYISQGKKTWYEAENFCMSREAHLTSVLSSEEQNYVTSQLTEPAWIGLIDGGQEKWEWTDGSRLIAQFWSQGQPGHSKRLGGGDQDCAIIVPSSKGQNWNDVDCSQLNRWVCKGTLGAEEHKIHQTH
ncbi:C-type lectin domain family 4 member F-like [Notechis scutatus]|uniref:C-type lectin domain family 4 member F-like n=1 Tax=Notechis scutatus TaxID=8663 RepID=A0A6J1W2F9_9SAUR|nr:C-type lectin domain family 4 member F-like [Notechis scutatus]